MMLILNWVAIVVLLLSYVSPYVNPKHFWPISFLGLGFMPIVAVNLLFVLYWAITFKYEWLFSFVAILLGWKCLMLIFQVNDVNDIKNKPSIKMMTYNVKVFDLYNWKHNKESRDKIFKLIQSESPDIICFQEFFYGGDFIDTTGLKKIFSLPFANIVTTSSNSNGINNWGLATYSRFPIVNEGRIKFGKRNNNTCIYTDLKIGKDTVRVYNVHLQSIHLAKQDYEFVEALSSEEEAENEVFGSKRILRRLKTGFIKRSRQVDSLAAHMQRCKYKIILAGDFNDTPISYAYQILSENLNDEFIESGNGFGASYNGAFPLQRID